MKGHFIGNIQALRALAVMLVVMRHIQIYLGRGTGGTPLLGTFLAGDLGVDLFFVISGCVMVVSHRESFHRAGDTLRFLYRRVSRIYPLYWLYSLPAAYIYLWHPQWLHRLELGMPVNLVQSFLLWPQLCWPLLGQAWSLVFEMYFYVVFAVLLCLPQRWLVRGLLVWACAVIVGNLLIGWQPALDRAESRLAFAMLTLEFIAGALVGLAILGVPPTRRAAALGWLCAGAGALWMAVLVVRLGAEPTEWPRVVQYGAPCVALVYGVTTLERVGIHLPRFLAVIGNWSYSIYLSHIFVIAALCRVLRINPSLGRVGELAMECVLIGGVLATGALSYHFVEAVLLRATRQLLPAQWTPPAVAPPPVPELAGR